MCGGDDLPAAAVAALDHKAASAINADDRIDPVLAQPFFGALLQLGMALKLGLISGLSRGRDVGHHGAPYADSWAGSNGTTSPSGAPSRYCAQAFISVRRFCRRHRVEIVS
jgi:hypothetical protein